MFLPQLFKCKTKTSLCLLCGRLGDLGSWNFHAPMFSSSNLCHLPRHSLSQNSPSHSGVWEWWVQYFLPHCSHHMLLFKYYIQHPIYSWRQRPKIRTLYDLSLEMNLFCWLFLKWHLSTVQSSPGLGGLVGTYPMQCLYFQKRYLKLSKDKWLLKTQFLFKIQD